MDRETLKTLKRNVKCSPKKQETFMESNSEMPCLCGFHPSSNQEFTFSFTFHYSH